MRSLLNLSDVIVDPYRVLQLPYSATHEDIRNAFLEAMKKATENEKESLIKAYGMIRDETGTQRVRWGALWSCLHEFDHEKAKPVRPSIDQEELIKELAFLSEWEMGDETCLN